MSDKPGSKTSGAVAKFLKLIGLGGNPREPAIGQSGNKVGPQGGHRGMAFGRVGGGREDVSPANRARWEKLRDTEAGNFVYNGAILYVHSTNVQAAQYEIESKRLILSFLNGGVYVYLDVSEDEAIEFANAQSKGSFVWDRLRVRGTKYGHKKAYHKTS